MPSTAIREISLLKDLEHHSIVQLFDIVIADASLYMVFEYLNMDLKKLLDKGKEVFTPKLVKVIVLSHFNRTNSLHFDFAELHAPNA